MAKSETQTHPPGEHCTPMCEECADREAQGRELEALWAMERPKWEWREWHRLFGDLEGVRRALSAALPLPGNDEWYWRPKEDELGRQEFPHAEEAVRHWLFDAAPSARAVMEALTCVLYRSQIAVLARYADLDRLPPALRARVAAVMAPPEMTPS